MGEKTTVQIDKKTLRRLKSVKLTKRESYDEIINRLLNERGGGGSGEQGRTSF